MIKPDGGPAFPRNAVMASAFFDGQRSIHTPHMPANNGMTLRDYFAAAALQGIAERLAIRCEHIFSNPEMITGIARQAFQYADAMLAERDK